MSAVKSFLLFLFMFSVGLSGIVPFAHAQAFPTKPIRLIVPYPPAGSTDFVAREVGAKMGEYMGHQVIIDNRPGAGTLLGLHLGAQARPDG